MDRLAIVGSSGMGALSYQPDYLFEISEPLTLDLDKIAIECENVLKTDYSDDLDKLFLLGGSSGGARPKILTDYDGSEWIIKFPSSFDSKDIGEQEYKYSTCARECGIIMEETKLFSSRICAGYFGTKRFDRIIKDGEFKKRIHMISVSGILETSHRIPNLDYNILMKLTLEITKDFAEIEKLFRIMCFNVFAHNRDDHSKNFTYLYNDDEKRWILSPAYDLTYSSSIGGEHATCVNGNGNNPSTKHILEVAKNIGIKERKAKTIADEIKSIVNEYGIGNK
jgi:serine/threonine-protein kinase HipA